MMPIVCLIMAAANAAIVFANPDGLMAPVNLGVAVLCFGVGIVTGLVAKK